MKVKLIIGILAVTFFSGIIHSNIINNYQYRHRNKYIHERVYCENEMFQIQLLDLKKSEIEMNKKLFKSYSTSYIRFDGENYSDICLDLIKTQIPNKGNLDFIDLYKYNKDIDGTIKEKEIFYDTYNGLKEIPISSVINT